MQGEAQAAELAVRSDVRHKYRGNSEQATVMCRNSVERTSTMSNVSTVAVALTRQREGSADSQVRLSLR